MHTLKYTTRRYLNKCRTFPSYPLREIKYLNFILMVLLFGVGCYVSSTSSTGKMVVLPLEVKFNQLSRLIQPPSIGDCLYKKPKQDVLFVTNVSICKKNVRSICKSKIKLVVSFWNLNLNVLHYICYYILLCVIFYHLLWFSWKLYYCQDSFLY